MGFFSRKLPKDNGSKKNNSLPDRANAVLSEIKSMAKSCHDRRAVFINLLSVPNEDDQDRLESSCLIIGGSDAVRDALLIAAQQNLENFSKNLTT